MSRSVQFEGVNDEPLKPSPSELKEFASKLVESILCKIKTQIEAPDDDSVDLTNCEVEVQAFLEKLNIHRSTSARQSKAELMESLSRLDRVSTQMADDVKKTKSVVLDKCIRDACGKSIPCHPTPSCCNARNFKISSCDSKPPCGSAYKKDNADGLDQDLDHDSGKLVEAIDSLTLVRDVALEDDDDNYDDDGNDGDNDIGVGNDYDGDNRDNRGSRNTLDMANMNDPNSQMPLGFDGSSHRNLAASANLKEVMTEDQRLRQCIKSFKENAGTVNYDDKTGFATELILSLYAAVRCKLEGMLQGEYGSGAAAEAAPFPTADLFVKVDAEVKEMVLPTIVERILLIMGEELDLDHIDCDMMMFAYAGQYVDMIITNAVLKTHVDLSRKRFYAKSFIVAVKGDANYETDASFDGNFHNNTKNSTNRIQHNSNVNSNNNNGSRINDNHRGNLCNAGDSVRKNPNCHIERAPMARFSRRSDKVLPGQSKKQHKWYKGNEQDNCCKSSDGKRRNNNKKQNNWCYKGNEFGAGNLSNNNNNDDFNDDNDLDENSNDRWLNNEDNKAVTFPDYFTSGYSDLELGVRRNISILARVDLIRDRRRREARRSAMDADAVNRLVPQVLDRLVTELQADRLGKLADDDIPQCEQCWELNRKKITEQVLTVFSERFVADWVLRVAEEQVEGCGHAVVQSLYSARSEDVVSLGRALSNNSSALDAPHQAILDSVCDDLHSMAVNQVGIIYFYFLY